MKKRGPHARNSILGAQGDAGVSRGGMARGGGRVPHAGGRILTTGKEAGDRVSGPPAGVTKGWVWRGVRLSPTRTYSNLGERGTGGGRATMKRFSPVYAPRDTY